MQRDAKFKHQEQAVLIRMRQSIDFEDRGARRCKENPRDAAFFKGMNVTLGGDAYRIRTLENRPDCTRHTILKPLRHADDRSKNT